MAEGPDADEALELRIVEAGARRDLGEDAAARLVLEGALGGRPDPAQLDAALASEIDEDRDALKRIMDRLDVSEDRIKASIFWLGERSAASSRTASCSSSPAQPRRRAEGLITGVSGKLSLWRTLLELAERDDRLEEGELEVLAGRAEDQLLRLHALRGAAGLIAFAADIA